MRTQPSSPVPRTLTVHLTEETRAYLAQARDDLFRDRPKARPSWQDIADHALALAAHEARRRASPVGRNAVVESRYQAPLLCHHANETPTGPCRCYADCACRETMCATIGTRDYAIAADGSLHQLPAQGP